MEHTDFALLLKQRGIRRIDLARALGVDKSMVTRWAQKKIPAERVPAISAVTGIPCDQLRPDIFAAATNQ